MQTIARSSAHRLPGLVAALVLAAGPALAQGTAEQREACAPDAINLCSDTIPDETKTKACMQRHLSQLSPRCRTVFLAATQPGEAPESPAAPGPAAGPPQAILPPPADPDDPMANYRATIAQECREGLIDPFTCRNTMSVLGGGGAVEEGGDLTHVRGGARSSVRLGV